MQMVHMDQTENIQNKQTSIEGTPLVGTEIMYHAICLFFIFFYLPMRLQVWNERKKILVDTETNRKFWLNGEHPTDIF